VSEAQVRRYWQDFWTDGHLEFARDFYADPFFLNDQERTPAQFEAGAAAFRSHFSDFEVTVDRVFAWEDVVVTRAVFHAKHVGAFETVPATGKPIELTGLDVFRFQDGLVVEHLHEADHERMWEQLGVELS